MTGMATCLIALGSNLGDRDGAILAALEALGATPHVRLVGQSSLLETEPVGGPAGQGPFLNAAAVVETSLDPESLLAELSRIEAALGRVRAERWGPRTIDLDLLLYDQRIQRSPVLTIPHPRMHERHFVLAPAAEVAPDMVHPELGKTVAELLAACAANRRPTKCEVVENIHDIQQRVVALKRSGKRLSVVPTMGALHEGHLSLVRIAREISDTVIATIFVNPTQFGPQEDFGKYPRMLAADVDLLSSAGCDLVFAPANDSIYPAGFSTYVDPPAVAQPLEGKCRPGHFRGVTTIVLKLLNIIPADFACFGQKDFQQALVIRRMVEDLNLPIEIVTCPIVREPDGLAMSSRNRYLSAPERAQALALSQALDVGEQSLASGMRESQVIIERMRRTLVEAGIHRIDYIALADPETLEAAPTIDGPAVALIAAFVGTTRLIDNRVLGQPLQERLEDPRPEARRAP